MHTVQTVCGPTFAPKRASYLDFSDPEWLDRVASGRRVQAGDGATEDHLGRHTALDGEEQEAEGHDSQASPKLSNGRLGKHLV